MAMKRISAPVGLPAILVGLVLACAPGPRDADADVIGVVITTRTTVFDAAVFVTGGSSPTSFGTVDIASLNSLLVAVGSAYQFTSLAGTSDWPGSGSGILELTGGIKNTGLGGDTYLTITESEDNFSSPGAGPGTLTSLSTATFDNAGAGNSHVASGAFNSIVAGPYTVASTSAGSDMVSNTALAPITFSPGYALTNNITFSLTTGASDSFVVRATAGQAVPEPAGLTLLGLGAAGLLAARRRARRAP